MAFSAILQCGVARFESGYKYGGRACVPVYGQEFGGPFASVNPQVSPLAYPLWAPARMDFPRECTAAPELGRQVSGDTEGSQGDYDNQVPPTPTPPDSGYASDTGSNPFRISDPEKLVHCSESGGKARQSGVACEVCGERAQGKFFGAYVCLPCKTFFIRCTTEALSTFECRRGDGRCEINSRTRSRCKYCRYARCKRIGMFRRERPEKVDIGEGQSLCSVCGDVSNGVHFGVVSCEGCKKFFRRGLREFQTYQCRFEGNCVINPRTRNECRYCRFQACVQAGMSRNAIRMGRPRKDSGESIKYNSETSLSPRVPDPQGCASVHVGFPQTSPTSMYNPSGAYLAHGQGGEDLRGGSSSLRPSATHWAIPGQSGACYASLRTDTPAGTATLPHVDLRHGHNPHTPRVDLTTPSVPPHPAAKPTRDFGTSSLIPACLKAFMEFTDDFEKNVKDSIFETGGSEAASEVSQARLRDHIAAIATFAKKIPGFRSFCLEDQFQVLNECTVMLCILTVCGRRLDSAKNSFLDLSFPLGHPMVGFQQVVQEFSATLSQHHLDSTERLLLGMLTLVSLDEAKVEDKENLRLMKDCVNGWTAQYLPESSEEAYKMKTTMFNTLLPQLKSLGDEYYRLSLLIPAPTMCE